MGQSRRNGIKLPVVITWLACIAGAHAVRITDLSVPAVVLNGSLPSVLLDCTYQLDQPTNSSAAGLVVKWYHNRSPQPVYQWIPGYSPQAFGPLRGRVNLGHVVSDDPLMRHRAVQLVQPRPELSGEYTCKVTTWRGVDVATKRMTVYAPVKSMSLSSSEPRAHQVTVTCGAEGMYPEPEVSLVVQGSRTSRERVRGLQVTKALVEGAYSVRATKVLDDREIPAQCLIHCQLTLPHTGYSVTEKIPHIRGSASRSTTPMFGRKEQYASLSLHHMRGAAPGVARRDSLAVNILLALLIHLAACFR